MPCLSKQGSLQMAHDGQDVISGANIVIDDLLATTRSTLAPVDRLLEAAKSAVRATVSQDGKVSNTLVEENQTAAHGLAWLATYAQSLHQMQLWAEKLDADGTFSETEKLIHKIAFGEYRHHDTAATRQFAGCTHAPCRTHARAKRQHHRRADWP